MSAHSLIINISNCISVLWSIVLAWHGAGQGFIGLCALRVLLGITESTVSPGFSLLTGIWYKPSEHAWRHGIWFLGNGIANTLGGLMAYGISHIDSSLETWRVSLLAPLSLYHSSILIFLVAVHHLRSDHLCLGSVPLLCASRLSPDSQLLDTRWAQDSGSATSEDSAQLQNEWMVATTVYRGPKGSKELAHFSDHWNCFRHQWRGQQRKWYGNPQICSNTNTAPVRFYHRQVLRLRRIQHNPATNATRWLSARRSPCCHICSIQSSQVTAHHSRHWLCPGTLGYPLGERATNREQNRQTFRLLVDDRLFLGFPVVLEFDC